MELQNLPDFEEAQYPDAAVLYTPDSIGALQALAAHHRSGFNIPIIGITGSNGKTIVKEWLSDLLSPDFAVVKSPQSYNSQIGVPLSVWQTGAEHQTGVFEAGISVPGEMERLEAIIRPTLGILTNIGTAHDEGFTSREQKTAEKMLLFRNCEALFYRHDEPEVLKYLQAHPLPEEMLKPWQASTEGTVPAGKLRVRLLCCGKAALYLLPFSDPASAENLLHCIAVLHYLNTPPEQIQQRINGLRNVAMRLEFKKGINNCYLIDDSYNNDLGGLLTALDALNQKNVAVKEGQTLILSDMLENGGNPTELYTQISETAAAQGISRFIGIGPMLCRYAGLFTLPASFYPDTEAFLQALPQLHFRNELILVKGARVFGFERIAAALQEKVHGTRLEIDLNAVAHNLNYYRSLLKPETKIMVMVKAFAYGSGSYEIANLLQFRRADYLAVAYADEGAELRRQGITLPIMVMNPAAETFGMLLHYQLEPDLYNQNLLQAFAAYLNGLPLQGRPVPKIHTELDTGMHRLGFALAETDLLAGLLNSYKHLWELTSVFSHLAAADEAQHDAFSRRQIADFFEAAEKLEQATGKKIIKHLLNSAGIQRYPEAQGDMVRLGIGLYGVEANAEAQHELQTVGRLKTTISQIHHLPAGETVGYGRKGVVSRPSAIATIAIGYADGFSRRFSNGTGKVLVNGHLAPVTGNVCMDMTLIDITGIPAQEGDEAIIFDDTLTIQQLAESIGTIPYEILTGVSERVKRVFYLG